jgi:riboflavin synthase
MFTGIVEELGQVAALEVRDRHATLEVTCRTVVEDVAVGDSIAVNGCCLTVTEVVCTDDRTGFRADLMAETLRATSLGDLAVGSPVNLERAMAAGGRLGGHLVQGHVDAVGEVVAREEQPGTVFVTVAAPAEVAPYLVAKGSVTVDGTSLTVVDVERDDDGTARFRVGLIPHTLGATTFGSRVVGDRVNLEADVIAKYVERLLAAGVTTPYTAPASR